MRELQFSVDINANKQKVWETLWNDATFRIWADLIDPGTYMVGEIKEGNEIQFISAENGYGVTSKVEQVTPGEYLLLLHEADTQDTGANEREKQWTGGKESYNLVEDDGTTTLTAAFDVPPELEQYFTDTFPKVMAKIKDLAEQS